MPVKHGKYSDPRSLMGREKIRPDTRIDSSGNPKGGNKSLASALSKAAASAHFGGGAMSRPVPKKPEAKKYTGG